MTFTTVSTIAIAAAAAEKLDLATFIASLNAAAIGDTADSTPQAAAVVGGSSTDILFLQQSKIQLPLPIGVFPERLTDVLRAQVCMEKTGCSVIPMPINMTAHLRKRILQDENVVGSVIFTVKRSFNAAVAETLAAPQVNTTTIASQLGVSASTMVGAQSTLEKVEAVVTVVSAAAAAAQSSAARQSALPSTVANTLGVNAADISFVVTPTIIGPPHPPPAPPPPPLPPPLPPPPTITTAATEPRAFSLIQSPPPSVPTGVDTAEAISVVLIASGSVEDYSVEDKAKIGAHFAKLFQVDPSKVRVLIRAASVEMDVQILVANTDQASSIKQTAQSVFGSVEVAAAFFAASGATPGGKPISVLSVPVITEKTIALPIQPSPPPMTDAAGTVAGVVGGVFALCFIAGITRFCSARKSSYTYPA